MKYTVVLWMYNAKHEYREVEISFKSVEDALDFASYVEPIPGTMGVRVPKQYYEERVSHTK